MKLADSLELHHRLPLLWDQAQAGLVATWKARRIPSRARDLSSEAARWVDRQMAGRASSLGASTLDRLVAEAAARHDSEPLKDRETRARESWDVALLRRDPDQGAGTSELHAVGDTLDLTRFHDVVCGEADAMGALGDTDTLGMRKTKALGVIADAQARLSVRRGRQWEDTCRHRLRDRHGRGNGSHHAQRDPCLGGQGTGDEPTGHPRGFRRLLERGAPRCTTGEGRRGATAR